MMRNCYTDVNRKKKSVIDWYRDNYQRGKRRNLLTDKNGRIVKVDKDGNITSDQKGKPLIIPNSSFDAPDDDDNSLADKLGIFLFIYQFSLFSLCFF